MNAKLESLKAQITKQQEARAGIEQFLSRVRKYTSITELSTLLLSEFVERIEIHAWDKSIKDKFRKIDIYFNFVGMLKLQESEPLPETPTYLLTEQTQTKSAEND